MESTTKKCVSCGKSIKEDAAFCRFCGASQARMIVCPHCDKEIKEGSVFCHFCGLRVPEDVTYRAAVPYQEPEIQEDPDIEANKPSVHYTDFIIPKEDSPIPETKAPAEEEKEEEEEEFVPETVDEMPVPVFEEEPIPIADAVIEEEPEPEIEETEPAEEPAVPEETDIDNEEPKETEKTAEEPVVSYTENVLSPKITEIRVDSPILTEEEEKDPADEQEASDENDGTFSVLRKSLKALVTISVEPHSPQHDASPEFNQQTLYIKGNISKHITSYMNTTDLGLFVRYRLVDVTYGDLRICPSLSYNLRSTKDEITFGNGWHFNYSSMVFRESNPDTFTVVYGDGDHASFTTRQVADTLSKTLNPLMRRTGSLVQQGDSFAYHDTDHYIHVFEKMPWSSDYHLTAISDRYGNTLDIEYDGSKIAEIKDPAGRSLKFGYDELSRCKKIELCDGSYFAFEYDKDNNLVSIKDSKDIYSYFTYSDDGYLFKIEEPNSNAVYSFVTNTHGMIPAIAAITDSAGHTTTFDRINPDPVTVEMVNYKDEKSIFVSRNGLTISDTPNSQHNTRIMYDSLNNPVVIADREYSYDFNENCVEISSDEGLCLSCVYDDDNNLLSATDMNQNTTAFTYDGYGRLINAVSLNGESITLEYSHKGMLTKKYDNQGHERNYSYDDNGNLISVSDENKVLRTIEYDKAGYVVKSDTDDQSVLDDMRPAEAMHLEYGCYPETKINSIIEQASF